MKHRLILVAGVACFLVSVARPAHAQWAVFDGTNLAQNALTAARTLQTVYNTYTEIDKMKEQIQNQLQTLKSIDPTTVSGLLQLIQTGQLTFSMIKDDVSLIGYNVGDINRGFTKLFPKNQSQWKNVQYSDFNGYYDGWNGEITSSSLAASRAQAALTLLDANNKQIQVILRNSKDATGEVRQLQLVNQQLALIHAELGSLVQNLTTLGRVMSSMAAASAGESMMARERSHRRLDNYTSRGKPSQALTKLP
jgi:P-type conjugative transfer protein TrbJ